MAQTPTLRIALVLAAVAALAVLVIALRHSSPEAGPPDPAPSSPVTSPTLSPTEVAGGAALRRTVVVEPLAEEHATLVRARFVDADGGGSIAGVQLRVGPRDPPDAWRLCAAASSSADGNVAGSIQLDRERADCVVVYEREGFSGGILEVELHRALVRDLGVIALTRGGTIRGRVHDETNAPVAGAHVWLEDGELPELWPEDVVRRRGPRPLDLEPRAAPLAAVTDALGNFTLHGAPAGVWRAWAHVAGGGYGWSAALDVDPKSSVDDVEIVLERLRDRDRISGAVLLPSGRPLPHAVVRYEVEAGGFETSSAVFCDERGLFDLIVLHAAPHTLIVDARPQEWAPLRLRDVAPGSLDVVLALATYATFDVVAEAPDGARIDHFDVSTRVNGDAGDEPPSAPVAAQSGLATLVLPADPFELRVEAPGYLPFTLGPWRREDAPTFVVCKLTPTPAVRGRVLAGGRPASGVTVRLYEARREGRSVLVNDLPLRMEASAAAEGRTDSLGRFALTPPSESASYYVLAHGEGWQEGWANAESGPATASDGMSDEQVLELRRGATLVVEVSTPRGLSAERIVVAVTRGDPYPRLARVAPGEASVAFEGLAPGPWYVTQADDGSDPSVRTVSVIELPGATANPLPVSCVLSAGEVTRFVLVARE